MANDGVKIAAAMAAGYLIGRTKKGRLVFAVVGGVLMAGRGLAKLGLDESRLGAVLTEVLGDVRSSAGEALNARVGQFSDNLQSRTEGLTGGLGLDQDEEAAQEDEGEADEEAPEDEEASEEEARPQSRRRGEESNGRGDDEEAPQPSRRPDRGRTAGGGGRREREPQAAGRGRR